ncbi:MAG: PEGA domain-containing protein [Myxococcota bacterium]
MRGSLVGGFIGLCTIVCAASPLRAQQANGGGSGLWVVIPAAVGSQAQALEGNAEVIRQALTDRGLRVWPPSRAAERFEVLGSAPAPEVSQRDIDRWVERSRAAVRYLARADYKAARRELKAAQHLADRAAEELNREAARAQQVLDTCLFMVRAYVETGNGAEARGQARECRRLVPRVEPTAFRHTPEVRDLLSEVDREMASEAPGSLTVLSSPTDCLARINGVEFGQTPMRDIELPVGNYRLQVECDREQRGRIHRVAVESGPNRITIDVNLDQVVRTRPDLHLAYSTHQAWDEDRMRDARQLSAALDNANRLVVSEPGDGVVRMDLDAADREPATVWLGEVGGVVPPEDARRGVDALLEGRSVDFSTAHPTAKPSWFMAEQARSGSLAEGRVTTAQRAARRAQQGPRPRGQRVAGWSLLAVGAASMGASVGWHVRRGTLGDRFVAAPADLAVGQDWQDARIPVWTLAAVGGASATAAMPLLLPNEPRTPWWGWTLGAAGLGLGAYGVYQAVTMTRCPKPFVTDEVAVGQCVDRGQEAGRVALSIGGAVPLLTVPLVYLFRPLRLDPTVSANRNGARLELRRVF